MKRILISVFSLALLLLVACVQKVAIATSGTWSGKIPLGANKLDVSFAITSLPAGKLQCTMDVPQQGAKDIPVELQKNDSDSLIISIPLLQARYSGYKVSSESIEGLFVQNGVSLPLNLRPGAIVVNRPQTPLPPFEYKTEEVVFKNEAEGAELSGTLTYPVGYDKSSPVSVVLMVTGSGSQDRNEELFNHKPFLVIADYLAKNGIASLRYDDRGVGSSKGSTKDVTTLNYLFDAKAGISYLRSLGKFEKVGVIGHSEGGTIAFMLGADGCADFLVSMAGSAAVGVDVILGQNRIILQQKRVPQNIINDYISALKIIYKDRVARKEIADNSAYVAELCKANGYVLPDNLKANLKECITAGGEWFTWFLEYNPAEVISRVTCPVMALNGSMDMQVLCKDNLSVIKNNLPHNEKSAIKEYDSLNHLFQNCTAATALDYGAIEETISEKVLVDIAGWINSVVLP